MPGLMCDGLSVCSRNVCQCDYAKKQTAPVEAKEFLSLEVVAEERLNKELISAMTKWYVGGTFQ
jgi:hypothetical protein